MRLNRFFGDFDLEQKTLQISDRDFLHQAREVLRLGAGDRLVLLDKKGNEAEAEIEESDSEFLTVKLLMRRRNENESARRVILFCAVLKKENFEWVVQKAVEAGVTEITPLLTRRTVKTGLKKERLEKIIKEAAEQSGRGILPSLGEPLELKAALEKTLQNKTQTIFFDVSGERFNSGNLTGPAAIFIGPEGGWDEQELELAKKNNIKIISLGPLTLRAETAAVVASYLVCQL